MESFSAVYAALAKFVPPIRSLRSVYTLDRMRDLLEHLGNPQESFRTIHVAGTSGKTSTCYYIAALLKTSGQKVGLTVSPHIDEVNERVQINLVPMSEFNFCRSFSDFLDLIKDFPQKLTYFEVLVAFAYWTFAREEVDYAVVEVGMGGLLDGTNLIKRSDKICVITDIGIDHTEILGRSLEEIASQKAGIIKPYNTVFMYEQDESVMSVVREVATQAQAELHEIRPVPKKNLPENMPLFQQRNWVLALDTYQYLTRQGLIPKASDAAVMATTWTRIPARMEIIQVKGKTLIMDGAHNTQKMQVLAKSIRAMFPAVKVATLLGVVQSKNFRLRTSLKEILKISSTLIVTSFDTQQDLRKKSVKPQKVADFCHELGFDNVIVENDAEEALNKLLEQPEEVLLITGSFYLLNQIRPLLNGDYPK